MGASKGSGPLDDRMAADARDRAFDPTELDLGGLRVTLRPVRAEDGPGLRELVARIDARDLRLRFGGDVDSSRRRAFARLVDGEDDVAFVASIETGGSGFEIGGDARARIDPHPYGASAEFAIVVRSDLQKRGLGRALLEKVIEGCRARGVKLLYGLVAASNKGMLALSRDLGFDIEYVPTGTTVVVSLDLQRQAPADRRPLRGQRVPRIDEPADQRARLGGR